MPAINTIRTTSIKLDDAMFGGMKKQGYSAIQRQKVQNNLEHQKQVAYADIIDACRNGTASEEKINLIKIRYYFQYKKQLQILDDEANRG